MFPYFCLAQGATHEVKGTTGNIEDHEWVQQTLNGLLLQEKVGQMLQVRYYADYEGFDNAEYKYLRDEIQKYRLGSVVLGMHFNKSGPVRTSPLNAAKVANRLQTDSKLPLLLAADLERGVASRLNVSNDSPAVLSHTIQTTYPITSTLNF